MGGFGENLRGKCRVARGLLRGGRDRHMALARLKAHRLRTRWRAETRRGRRVVAVGLVEHMGDIVAAEPIARHLRAQYPGADIVWAVRPAFRALVDTNPHIDAALPVGCLSEWIYLKARHPFDALIDLHVPGRDCPVCRLQVQRARPDLAIDITNYYSHGSLLRVFCECGGLPPLDDGPRLYIPDDVRRRVDTLGLPEAFVAVHGTSNQDVRDWDPAKWQRLAETAAEDGVPVVEVGLKPVIAGDTPGYTDLCGRLSILETAEVIARARAFVGIDSGPAHLANAAGTYGIVLLGHYRRYTRYMPYSGAYADGTNAAILFGDGPASAIPVAQVREALRASLSRTTRAAEAAGSAGP